jgi:hypothetical protein
MNLQMDQFNFWEIIKDELTNSQFNSGKIVRCELTSRLVQFVQNSENKSVRNELINRSVHFRHDSDRWTYKHISSFQIK